MDKHGEFSCWDGCRILIFHCISWSFLKDQYPKAAWCHRAWLAGNVPIWFDDVPINIFKIWIYHGFPRIYHRFSVVFTCFPMFHLRRCRMFPLPGSAIRQTSYSASLVKTSKAWSCQCASHMVSVFNEEQKTVDLWHIYMCIYIYIHIYILFVCVRVCVCDSHCI